MTAEAHDLSPATVRQLSRYAREAQIDSRAPALVAGVGRAGRVLWAEGVGRADLSDPSVPLGADTQYLVASNTKTFSAVMIMQLRDEGRLTLDDTVDRHIAESTHPQVTIRQMLSHVTGMQREPVGDVWDTLQFPDRVGLVESWNAAHRILRPHSHWHYSNLCFGMLGEIIARLDGCEWRQSLQRRLLDPLELHRTTLALAPPHTAQYFVGPYTDVPVTEPLVDKTALDAAGSICSTLGDMVVWHDFLVDPDPRILHPDTAAEMREPQIMADTGWTSAWGLGLQLVRHEGITWIGHTGGLPGAITGFFTDPESKTTGAVLMNNTAAKDPAGTAVKLGAYAALHDPAPITPWVPGTSEPAELKPLVGQWFSEGNGFTFSIGEGRLQARMDRAPAQLPPSIFAATGTDSYVTVSGREQGEALVVRRHPDGSVRQLNWATYRFTREPLSFGDTVEPGPTHRVE
ncbi:serine hydrolase domain-containing protein [Leekyejoonella antrihumi]|uniref:Beta-lactamase family protein n=1 Tax=Leekyejoonella antrihumi TaxID=1660198 RepID=A0A563DVR6_9MICO|nr:serine hydrolase domain-containing protein [Leekyejoonella antrihumi]TWP34296.1 beta-lactamase family protein [Leekyejoonella antrihumi]